MKLISIVVPMFNEEKVVDHFFAAVNETLASIESCRFEIIVVNDGSQDRTLDQLDIWRRKQSNIGIVSFSRNFGHEAAVDAGLKYAQGDAVIVMDADMQDPPELIGPMIEKWAEGYEVVNAKRRDRHKDGFWKRWTAQRFYKTLNWITHGIKIPEDVANFRLLTRRVVDEINALPEKNRVLRVMIPLVGYRSTEVEFERNSRIAGETHYSWSSMFRLALDGITSSSTAPLKWGLLPGIICTMLGLTGLFLCVLYLGASWFTPLAVVSWNVIGWLFLVSILLTLGGGQLTFLGILSEYIARIFIEVKSRPTYHVEKIERPHETEIIHKGQERNIPALNTAAMFDFADTNHPASYGPQPINQAQERVHA